MTTDRFLMQRKEQCLHSRLIFVDLSNYMSAQLVLQFNMNYS